MRFTYHLYSNKGPRNENQDSVAVKELDESSIVACIADGVGGHQGGKIASALSTGSFLAALAEDSNQDLSNLIKDMHNNILLEAQNDLEKAGMATTFSGCVISSNGLKGVHSGDSRLMLLRANGILQLTHDQTEVARLLSEGLLSKESAYNYPRKQIVENALGIEKPLVPQIFSFDIEKGDRILLTTDGVHNKVVKAEIRDISLQSSTPEDFLTKLINIVESRKPSDNYSALVVFVQ